MHKQMSIRMREPKASKLQELISVRWKDRADPFSAALRMDATAVELDLGAIRGDQPCLKMHCLKDTKAADPLKQRDGPVLGIPARQYIDQSLRILCGEGICNQVCVSPRPIVSEQRRLSLAPANHYPKSNVKFSDGCNIT